MNYSVDFLVYFVDELIALDNEYKSAVAQYNELLNNINNYSENGRKSAVFSAVKGGMDMGVEAQNAFKSLFSSEDTTAQSFLNKHEEDFHLLGKYNTALSLVRNVESNFNNPQEYEHFKNGKKVEYNLTAQEFADNEQRLLDLIFETNLALMGTDNSDKKKLCSKLNCYCTAAQSVLEEAIRNIRETVASDKTNAVNECKQAQGSTDRQLADYSDRVSAYFDESSSIIAKQFEDLGRKKAEMTENLKANFRARLDAAERKFLNAFPILELSEEYDRIYRNEPNYSSYQCTDDIPHTICIGKFEYDLAGGGFSDFALSLLDRYYSFMYDGARLTIPQCVAFDGAVNYMFKYDGNASDTIRTLAGGIAMRLFMMTQIGKINFTFYDPVALGGSFIDFSSLVNIDDRSAELINGKIWTTTEDIEDRLHHLTEHISGVTQRCLRGQFRNIYEYNKDAGYNAEPYQVIVIMDYPASLSDNALRLIEQIAQSGPKCGVFILLFQSTNQRWQLRDNSVTLADSLESYFPAMQYESVSDVFKAVIADRDYQFIWQPAKSFDNEEQKKEIFETLKAGIKAMEKVVIGVDRLKNAEVTDNTIENIRVPIGIAGVNSIQYLTFGVGSCHHALIAGIAGTGKSSLLHTIIMQCLKQYSPEELQIYLVDFKRGVEFKVYADYRIPHFKVIAVESEREFGYNVLKTIDREQKVRADIFKNFNGASRIEKIGEFRKNGGKLPRILVIMDEFHELFTEDDEISKQSAVMMERIVRQGRAFGVHLILSSQSYANVKGLDKAVYDQMAVRMVMKCSADDANMLLENGSGMVDMISAEEAGRAIYNSESGSKAACSMFRAAYIYPEQHRAMLEEISERCRSYPDGNTRILLSNIEDSVFSKFNCFANPDYIDDNKQVIVGESLDFAGHMNIDFKRAPQSNLLMIGDNTEKARTLFCFTIISLCIDNWLKNGKRPPAKPFIKLFNFKPLIDDYFIDTLKTTAEMIPNYVDYVDCSSIDDINSHLGELYSDYESGNSTDSYLAVFGYQRAEAFRSGTRINIDFATMPASELVNEVMKSGSEHGVHTIMWQNKLSGLSEDYTETISMFSMRIAFDMPQEAIKAFIMEDNADLSDDNSAMYYNRLYDNQKFRVYQSPHINWIENLCQKLNSSLQ